jgi:hypothetical protein
MHLYNSASFFGRRTRRVGHAHAHHHHIPIAGLHAHPAANIVNAGAVAAPLAAQPLAVKNLSITDATLGEDAVMMSNDSIRDHIAENPDNISIVYRTGRNFRVANTRRSDFTRHGNELYRYECGVVNPNHHRLASLQRVGLSIGGGFVDMSRGKITNTHQVYFLEPVRVLARTASVPNGYCQADTGGQLFDIYPAHLTPDADVHDLTGFGRRRKSSSSNQQKKRKSNRRRR